MGMESIVAGIIAASSL